MRENEMIQTLKQEVEIPEIVQHKADEAFIKIKTEATQKKNSRFTQRTKHNLISRSGMVDIVNQTATDAGVTITVEQTIADENFAYIAFKIEGYDLPDGAAPAIEETKITVGGHMVDCFGYFYDGIVWDENGSPIMADGSRSPI